MLILLMFVVLLFLWFELWRLRLRCTICNSVKTGDSTGNHMICQPSPQHRPAKGTENTLCAMCSIPS